MFSTFKIRKINLVSVVMALRNEGFQAHIELESGRPVICTTAHITEIPVRIDLIKKLHDGLPTS